MYRFVAKEALRPVLLEQKPQIFQSEIYAILVCTEHCRNLQLRDENVVLALFAGTIWVSGHVAQVQKISLYPPKSIHHIRCVPNLRADEQGRKTHHSNGEKISFSFPRDKRHYRANSKFPRKCTT
jgi:hypothetical protein